MGDRKTASYVTTAPERVDPEDTTRRLSPAERSDVMEVLAALGIDSSIPQRLDLIVAALDALRPVHSGDSVVMSKSKRAGYRFSIAGLGVVVTVLLTLVVPQVRAYGDDREAAVRASIAAESKAADAARYAEETREVAEGAAKHASEIDKKLDRVLRKLEEMDR